MDPLNKPDERLVARGWKPALFYSSGAVPIVKYYKDPNNEVINPRRERIKMTGLIEALEAEGLPDFEE